MKVLVVGSGGREHAICRAVAKSSRVDKIYCAPGNAGIAALAECVPIGAMEFDKLVAFAKEKEIDFTIINNKAVSRRHAVIERINGTYYLMDKGSTNHTYLNGEMLDAENSYVLSDHDSIQIADEEFTFYFN